MTRRVDAAPDASALEREAAAALAVATGLIGVPGTRELHRARLADAIDAAEAALAAEDATLATQAGARSTLVRALAARAEDARHGAGQLSQSAQRAPTREACEDGWQRVEEIVAGAESAARQALQVASESGSPALLEAAGVARTGALEARRIVDTRNHAYTFHADPGFSFGEGWYLAAAALLAKVEVQIEPDQAQTRQAEHFLSAVGLGGRPVPYRSRPRANKQLPDIVAKAFRADPLSAQRKLRAAFLGDDAIPHRILDWTDRALSEAPAGAKVLLWVRRGGYQSWRNTGAEELLELTECCVRAGLVPVWVGDAPDGGVPNEAVDLTLFWKEPLFQGDDMRRAQLQFFEHLKRAHALVGQLGVTTAGMDGPALMGLPTLYLTDAPNVRMSAWIGAVPGYRGLVRGEGYLERVSEALREWALGCGQA